MKNKIKLVAFVVFTMVYAGVCAQNSFIGTVKYSIQSVGQVAMQLQQNEMIVKVYKDNMSLKNEGSQQLVKGRNAYTVLDYSSIIGYLKSNEVWESSYEGDGKFIIKAELEDKDIDSLTIPVTEGFYFEYIDNETKDIAGYKAKKARLHLFNEEGEDKGFDIWYTNEIGPEYDLMLVSGLKGFPLEFVVQVGDGKALGYQVTEVSSGKVKDVDMLLPSGYDEVTNERFGKIMKEIQEAAELLGE